MSGAAVAGVLFDLDGTLVDSAPDLAGAVNELRGQEGLGPLPLDALRHRVGSGARGMLAVALDVHPGDPRFEPFRDRFLALYEQRLDRLTRLFEGVSEMLRSLDEAGLPWGIVTNKATRFAMPLVDGLGLGSRAGVVIAGDTTPHAKPHPAPLLEAARRMRMPPESAVYVGDDLRDIVAGRAASMRTWAAGWGYLGDDVPISSWGATAVINRPNDVLKLLRLT